jgi:alkylated DNA repair protein alkB family protein 1
LVGLRIVPNLLPPIVQQTLLSRLLHRDLSDSAHKSNVHLHHHVEYPSDNASFFSLPPDSNFTLQPKDSSVHKPIKLVQLLNKKLRWITLGGQYDWTNKVYPSNEAPEFPQDIAGLLQGVFPEMKPQAAIVNFYSPGDTLSLHRDVAEDCDRGLVSISIGCDGIFIMGLEVDESSTEIESTEGKDVKTLAIRLRSGDAVYMDGPSRFAWHGVPQIIPDTCPDWLKDWPAGDGEYEDWKAWMTSKRINLNVRQMSD